MKVSLFFGLFFLMIFSSDSFATHIIGGDIHYECLGNNQYRITMNMYRDASGGTAALQGEEITIWNASNLVTPFSRVFISPQISNVPILTGNLCLTAPPGISIQQGKYITTLTLPQSTAGYYVAFERCCRNHTIINLTNPGSQGTTISTFIPATGTCNGSPKYNNFPPPVICVNEALNYDHSATDPDGDSLVYSLCAPVLGGSSNDPSPSTDQPPPYPPVVYATGYSASNPLPANPALAIDPQTGILTGTPNTTGQYVVGICVAEYKNGVLIATHLRDFQFNVVQCILTAKAVIDVPASDTLSTSDTIFNCKNLTINFYAGLSDSAKTYNWDFGDPTTTADISNSISPTYTYPSLGYYTARLIINQGTACSDTDYVVIKLVDPVTADFSFTRSCPGLPIQFTNLSSTAEGTITGYKWYFGNGDSSTLTNPTVIYPTVGNRTVTLTVTNSQGCTKTISKSVSHYPLPVANFSTGLICVDKPTQFNDLSTVSGGVGGWNWNFGDGSPGSNIKNPSHVFNDTGTYIIKLIATSNNGCKDSITRTIYVKSGPVAVASNDTMLCSGSSARLQASGGLTYQWKPATGLSNPNISNPIATPPVSTIYTVIVSDSCHSDSAFVNITIRPQPISNFSYVKDCSNLPINFTASPTPNDSLYIWDFGNGSNASGLNPIHNFNDDGPFNVTLTVTNKFGCVEDTTISVLPFPTPKASFDHMFPCWNKSIQFTNTTTIASGTVVSYLYDFGDGTPTTTNSDPLHIYVDSGNYLVRMIATSDIGCIDTVDKIFPINPPPIASAAGDTSICIYDSAQVFAYGGPFYNWEPVTGVSDPNVFNPKVSPPVTTTYTVTVADSCYDDKAQVTVVVMPRPAITVSQDLSMYYGEIGEVYFSGGSDIATSLWSPDKYFVPPSKPTDKNISVSPDTTTVYYILATGINGCTSLDSVLVEIDTSGYFVMPNAFSPNNDNLNDVLKPIKKGRVEMEYLKVYNRWGELIFETSDINSGWDGTYKGENQPAGSYVFVIKASTGISGKDFYKKGSLTLIR